MPTNSTRLYLLGAFVVSVVLVFVMLSVNGFLDKNSESDSGEVDHKEWLATFTVKRQLASMPAVAAIGDPSFDFEGMQNAVKEVMDEEIPSLSFQDLKDARVQASFRAGAITGQESLDKLKDQISASVAEQDLQVPAGQIAFTQMQRSIALCLAKKNELQKKAVGLAKQFAKTQQESFRTELVAVNKRIAELKKQARSDAVSLTEATRTGRIHCRFHVIWEAQ